MAASDSTTTDLLPQKRKSATVKTTKPHKSKRIKKRESLILAEAMRQTRSDDIDKLREHVWKEFGQPAKRIRDWTNNKDRKKLLLPNRQNSNLFSHMCKISMDQKNYLKGCCITMCEDDFKSEPFSLCGKCSKFIWHDTCRQQLLEQLNKTISSTDGLEGCPSCIYN